jgi:hypothetical protein
VLIVAYFSLLAEIAHAVDETKEITNIASDENNISLTLMGSKPCVHFKCYQSI